MKKTIPRRSRQRFDGELIYLTKDCSDCNFYRKTEDQNLCGGGLAFKYLIPRKEGLRNCVVKSNTKELSEESRSIKYLDKYLSGEISPNELNSGNYVFPKRGKYRSSLVQLKINFKEFK